MADIELVIKLPEEAKQAFDCAESNDLKGCYYDHGGVIGNAIKNGTPLPKGHGRLIDADMLKKNICKWLKPSVPDESMLVDIAEVGADVCKEIEEQPTIIDADKENDNERTV